MHLDVALCLPHEVETVSLIRGVIAAALDKLGITEECVHDISLALSEACTNVVDHTKATDEYEVRLQVNDDRCAITVTNTGTGFDASSLRGVAPDATSERGRGVSIMDAVMDRVNFTSEPESGSIVHLVKTLDLLPDGPMARLARRGST
jgi:serine/threonine-protein kinase RsbW